MKTKEKILHTALRLFNEQGTSEISSRNISDEMGISYGNLCYHFPKKSDIILALYRQMQDEVTELIQNIQREIFRFDFMVRSLRELLHLLHKYRFVFIEHIQLARKFDSIKQESKRQFERRKDILREVSRFLLAQGYLRPEEIRGHHDMIIHALLIVLNSWIPDGELFYNGKPEKIIDYYLELYYSVFRANLTPKGARAFDEVYNALALDFKRLQQDVMD
ncbi:MAG: TetR/AcrR family transcriptional regulator [Bacteroidetes bacterium]|nr:MAG: TetR/AcrR family transcriptional regulator [Bacteroidota bacterium]